MTDLEIIDEIQRVRSNNNKIWMDLVRLAVTVAPVQAKEIFRHITDNDEQVSRLLRTLAQNSG